MKLRYWLFRKEAGLAERESKARGDFRHTSLKKVCLAQVNFQKLKVRQKISATCFTKRSCSLSQSSI
jgi:hypothetical protein